MNGKPVDTDAENEKLKNNLRPRNRRRGFVTLVSALVFFLLLTYTVWLVVARQCQCAPIYRIVARDFDAIRYINGKMLITDMPLFSQDNPRGPHPEYEALMILEKPVYQAFRIWILPQD